MNRRLVMVLAAAALAASTGPAGARPPMPAQPAPGGFEIVWSQGRQRLATGHGLAEIEQGVPVGPATVFRLSSLTKPLTAVAVLALVEDGKLRLDQSLAESWVDCPPAWRDITLRQLLSHTSGLTWDFAPLMGHLAEDMTPKVLVGLYADRPPATPPGARWSYSNLNYWILGQVIAEASGMTWERFIQQRVLAPAGVDGVRVGDNAAVIPLRAHGYVKGAGGWRNAPYFSGSIGYAAGGLVATPEELARWYDALSRGKVVSPASITEALTPVRTADGELTGYGLGFFVEEVDGRRVASHGGSSPGFRSYLYWDPQTATVAAVLLNHDDVEEPNKRALELFRKALSDR